MWLKIKKIRYNPKKRGYVNKKFGYFTLGDIGRWVLNGDDKNGMD